MTIPPAGRATIEARQRPNGCNLDDEPGEWGQSCCSLCICEREARLGIILCADCGDQPADVPGKLCPGCAAYRAHTS